MWFSDATTTRSIRQSGKIAGSRRAPPDSLGLARCGLLDEPVGHLFLGFIERFAARPGEEVAAVGRQFQR